MLSAREIECRRRRRERREALAKAELEFVNGGPLIDQSAPVMGPGMNDAQYHAHLRIELFRRAYAMDLESRRLAVWFADGCWLVKAERDAMLYGLLDLLNRIGLPGSAPTHSTLPGATANDIPALDRR